MLVVDNPEIVAQSVLNTSVELEEEVPPAVQLESTFQSYEVPGCKPVSVKVVADTVTEVHVAVPVFRYLALYVPAPEAVPQFNFAPVDVIFVVVKLAGVEQAIV